MEKIILNIIFIIVLFSNSIFADNYFVKSEIKNGELKLYFSSNIEGVKYFTIPTDDGATKFVYDIYGATLPKGKGISHHTYKTVESFRIAQNNSERVRVVIKSSQKSLNRHAYRDNLLVIPLRDNQDASISGRTIANIGKKDKKIVVIDAGHGGKDNGACCKGIVEKNIVFNIAKKVKIKLENMGYRVYMTRNSDRFIKLPKRTEFANRKMADVFVSIHANAAPTLRRAKLFRGIEIYYLSPAKSERAKRAAEKENSVMFEDKDFYTKNAFLSLLNREKIIESHKLGLDVRRYIVKNLKGYKVHDSGVKTANFWVLVGAQMPSILVEVGYITNPIEGKNLLTDKYQSLLAKGIAKGIDRYIKNNY